MLYYIGYYNCDLIREEDRIVAPASENKMGYMISAISEAYERPFEIVSPAGTRRYRYIKGNRYQLNKRAALKTFSSFNSKMRFLRIAGHLFTKLSFFLYLLFRVRSTDHLLVYHSLAYMRTIKLIRKIKKCKLTIEVEELYSDVTCDAQLRKKELGYLQIADHYIFITELLRTQVNTEKDYLISHGTYRTNPKRSDKFDDGNIHVVYAGSFNPVKGGAIAAVEAAEFLSPQYTLHILGKGNPKDTEAVINRIEDVSRKAKCKIIFDGYKSGKEFEAFIQSCHIGLSTQQPDGKYNASSFPSKILMYMSNGIPVVSIRIPAVETSNVGDYIFFYDSPSPQEIAKAIMKVALDGENSVREKLTELDERFMREIAGLLH